ncbi:MAG: tetratricopeptide repeat protein [Limimaricola sp.]|uniref:heme biosynthesis protein HemY n=1 Tax=Limimaricola sp. TaxID=2211665 RepID=UPI001DFD6FA4|nr:heme biosynthesis HemY N-terminal domain-containing protein [Limimaricola sp.]MBI1417245.1 tetratricopeptide repeat protein [Limimaricola sp.]
MLWSLIKILAFVAAVTAMTYGAVHLSDLQGGATITFAGIEVSLSPLEVVAGLLALVVLVWVGLKLLGLLVATFNFLNGDETAISRYFSRNRERKGYQALSEGMMALALGEGHLALAKATKAERYLEKPELTTLLAAQAAELVGDRAKAEETYKRLLEDDRTRFVGIRGLMKQRLDAGEKDTALALAQKALELKPKHEDTQDVLLQLQAEKGDWQGARATLAAKLKAGYLPRDVHRRRDAVLALSEAQDVLADGASIEQREQAIEANKLSPDLIPAATMAARSYIADGNTRFAQRILAKAWTAQPHPDLAAAFAEIAPDESPKDRLKRFRALTKINPDHPETRMLLAELNIAAEDFPEARRAIADLVEKDPTARSLTLMAAVERGQGADDAVVRGWLTKALTAPRGPQWICGKCHNIHPAWVPVCANCHGFDTLSWSAPPKSDVSMPAGAEMLPLIVGGPAPGDAPETPNDAAPNTTEVLPPDPDEANEKRP